MSEFLISEGAQGSGQESALLIVGWRGDSGRLGERVVDHLRKKLECRERGRLGLERFFAFDGVNVENNVVQFPESTLYASAVRKLLLFLGDPPQYEWYDFLNALIDGAERAGKVRALYTVGGMASVSAHTQPRELLTVSNSEKAKRSLSARQQSRDIDYQSPLEQKPTLSSFLLWVAQRRDIPAVSLWVPIPFYLATAGDARAEKTAIDFFSRRFNWDIDLGDLEGEADRQHEVLARVRGENEEIDDCINRLECRRDLTEEEQLTLIRTVEEALAGRQ